MIGIRRGFLEDAPGNFMNSKAVAKHLGVATITLTKWRMKGIGPRYIKIGSYVRYRPDDVRAWIEIKTVNTSV